MRDEVQSFGEIRYVEFIQDRFTPLPPSFYLESVFHHLTLDPLPPPYLESDSEFHQRNFGPRPLVIMHYPAELMRVTRHFSAFYTGVK